MLTSHHSGISGNMNFDGGKLSKILREKDWLYVYEGKGKQRKGSKEINDIFLELKQWRQSSSLCKRY